MKIVVELEEFWTDGEGESLAEDLKRSVTRQVLSEIQKSIKEKVDAEITRTVKSYVEQTMYREINTAAKQIIAEGKIKSRYNSNEMVTIEEYVRQWLAKDSRWDAAYDTIEKIAGKLASDMKTRYDVQFANQIVLKLNENKMLAPNVAQILLSEPKDGPVKGR